MSTTKILSFVGGMVGSYAGWWLGSQFGEIMTSFMVSIVGTAAGIYIGRRIAKNYEV